jgi:hypothetical protein
MGGGGVGHDGGSAGAEGGEPQGDDDYVVSEVMMRFDGGGVDTDFEEWVMK